MLGHLALAGTPPTEEQLKAYEVTDFGLLRAAPEEYRNKKVAYEGRYLGFTVTFLKYMEESGFKASRYIGFSVNGVQIPIMAKKNDDLNELFGAVLKKGAKVKVYGKIRQFRRSPKATMLPRHYLSYVYLEILDNTARSVGQDKGAGGKQMPPRRRFRRRGGGEAE